MRPWARLSASVATVLVGVTGLLANPAPAAAAWERTLTISFGAGEGFGDGRGRITSDDGAIDCTWGPGATGDCSEHYVFPDFVTSHDVTLTIDPDPGSYACRSGVIGCDQSGATLYQAMSFSAGSGGDVTLNPVFSRKSVQVAVDVTGPGTVTSNSTLACTPPAGLDLCWTYKYGDTVALKAKPDSGYPFSWWLGAPCEAQGRDNPCTFSAADDSQITAAFGFVSMTIRGSTGGSICEVGGSLCLEAGQTALRDWRMIGSTSTFAAVAKRGYAFDHWNAGPCSARAAICTFTLRGATELIATFQRLATPTPRATTSPRPTGSATATATAVAAAPSVVADASLAVPSPPVTSNVPDGSAAPAAVTAGTARGLDGVLPIILATGAVILVLALALGFVLGRRRSGETGPS
jgi:hypothetical protein